MLKGKEIGRYQPSPVGSASATPPPGGSNEGGGACAYLPAARGLAQAGLAGMDDSIADLFSDQWKPTIKEL